MTPPPGIRSAGTNADGAPIFYGADGVEYTYKDDGTWGRWERHAIGVDDDGGLILSPSAWIPYAGASDFPAARPGAWLVDVKWDNPGASWWNVGVDGSTAYKASSPSGQQARIVRDAAGNLMLELPSDAINAGATTGDGSGWMDTVIRTAATIAIGSGITTGIAGAMAPAPDVAPFDLYGQVYSGPAYVPNINPPGFDLYGEIYAPAPDVAPFDLYGDVYAPAPASSGPALPSIPSVSAPGAAKSAAAGAATAAAGTAAGSLLPAGLTSALGAAASTVLGAAAKALVTPAPKALPGASPVANAQASASWWARLTPLGKVAAVSAGLLGVAGMVKVARAA